MKTDTGLVDVKEVVFAPPGVYLRVYLIFGQGAQVKVHPDVLRHAIEEADNRPIRRIGDYKEDIDITCAGDEVVPEDATVDVTGCHVSLFSGSS